MSSQCGLATLGRQGAAASERSNKLMRWRIGLQFAALVIIVLFMFAVGD